MRKESFFTIRRGKARNCSPLSFLIDEATMKANTYNTNRIEKLERRESRNQDIEIKDEIWICWLCIQKGRRNESFCEREVAWDECETLATS